MTGILSAKVSTVIVTFSIGVAHPTPLPLREREGAVLSEVEGRRKGEG